MKVDLDAIKARLEAATTGPWRVEPDSRPDILTVWTVDGTGGYFDGGQILRNTRRWKSDVTGSLHVAEFAKYANGMEDAEFIAHAPEDIAALVAEVERLRAVVEIERIGHLAERARNAELVRQLSKMKPAAPAAQ